VTGLLIRVLGIGFALIQGALLMRLLLPFIDPVPKPLRGFVRPLVELTDALMAPFKGLVEPFDLAVVLDLPKGVEDLITSYANRVDPAVIVAMLGWALIGAVTLLVLRLVFRPR
jgi:hypothetical protein